MVPISVGKIVTWAEYAGVFYEGSSVIEVVDAMIENGLTPFTHNPAHKQIVAQAIRQVKDRS